MSIIVSAIWCLVLVLLIVLKDTLCEEFEMNDLAYWSIFVVPTLYLIATEVYF